jgi:amino acid adenylation domain-containing protein
MSTAKSVSQPPRSGSIFRILRHWADLTPESIAVSAPGHAPLTYRGLLARVESVVETLNASGIGRNDRVAVALPNGPDMAVALLAVAAGASCAPLNPAYRANELAVYLQTLRASALIVQPEMESAAKPVADSLGIPVFQLSPRPEMEAGVFDLAGRGASRAARSSFAESADVALVLHTSGTTSRPKIVPLTQANLCASADNIRNALKLVQGDRCLNVMPLFHIHGLVGAVLSSLAAGASVVCTPGFYATEFFEWLDEFRPTWYTAVPTMHRAVLARASGHREITARAPLRLVRSCSSPLPSQAAAELEKTFGAPVIDAYGMTEACHQIASTPIGRRKPGSVGVAAGTEIAIMDDAGNRLSAGEDGEIAIRGASVMRGYEGTSKNNREAFTGGWFRTGDLGRLDGDGYLYITGRLKEIINRAGEKISPGEVEEALLAHPAVKEAVVFALPHAELGEEVSAAVVLRDNAAVSAGELRRCAAEHIADFKLPTRIVFVPAIPAGPTGKIERLRLAERLGVVAAAMDGPMVYVAPRTPVETQLSQLWSEVLGVARVGIHDNFFTLGGDSVLAAQILSRVRKVLHGEISFLSLFEAPTVAAMADLLATAPAVESAALPRAPETAAPPLSYGQERMWFLDQLEPGNPAYNRPAFYRLDGALDAGALEKSLQEIVARHEVLRAAFPSAQGRPLQVFSSGQAPTLQFVDLEKLPEARRRTEAERLAAVEATRPFDLAQGPLLRATLLRLSAVEHVLLVTAHHIVFDGWSEAIFLRELTTLYDAFSSSRPSPLSALPIRYIDYAVWQRGRLQGRLLEEQLSYWKRQLSGAAVLDLPADRPRPAAQTFRGARKSVVFAKALCGELKAFSRRQGATLFMTLLTAFQTLLHRYTGQDDIVVGSPIAGRSRSELEGLIGVFINTLVFRGDLSGDPSFRDLLARTRRTALETYERQDLPFEKLVEELRPERDPSRTPLFQVMFVLENTPRAALEFPGVTASPFDVDSGTAKLDLSVSVEEAAGSLKAVFEYNTDLFEHSTMDRMMGHFETLLQSIVADPGRRLSELRLLTEAERHRLLVEWNDTKRNDRKDKCIHELFEEQVERTPDAVAVVFEDERLTYRELNRRANQLAHYLKKLGVGPEALVGLCAERSLEMIVGLLAILKAGAAYVPLDASCPNQRLEFMLQDTGMAVLLSQQRLVDGFPHDGMRTICLDADGHAVAPQSDSNPISCAKPENLVYVIYTSGSTGTPKGVLIEHRQILNYVHGISERLNLAPGAGFAMVQPLSADSSQTVIFPSLISGGCLHVISEDRASDPRALSEYFSRFPIDLLKIAPSHLAALQISSRPEKLLPRRWLVVGGEVSRWDWMDRLQATASCSIFNHYGPTEATVGVLTYAVRKNQNARSSSTVPIGRPLPNTHAFLLDRHLQPVPIGVPGELCIGGDGLARGYLNRPELTAEKFFSNPFSDDPQARLYKTGDLARYLPDGNIEFLGRIDDQVKIRGFRVEPGEIEAILGQHSGVCESVVIAHEDTAGKHLAAYVVPRENETPAIGGLRSFLRSKLPEYMVPSTFILLDALPRTPHGKVDRRALPPPSYGGPGSDETLVEPRNPVEKALVKIWSQVLGLERVGVDDNFFALGGHSLLATQVISRVREAYVVELSLRSFFESPTVAQIARLIQQAKDDGAPGPLPKISRAPRHGRAESLEGFDGTEDRDKTIINDSGRESVLVERNRTEKVYPTDKRIHELFEEQVVKTPDAVAAVFEDQRLTYRELNRRANQLAHYLKKSGVGPETLVGICVERSLEMMVGLLGILKAGGAYVALNPDYPGERLAFMLAETRCDILLTRQELRDRFPAFTGRALCLNRDRGLWEKEQESNPAAAGAPDDLAYVMYTSGSTGRPKGVLVPHRGVVNYFFYLRETFNLDGADTVLQLAPFSFDASVRDLLGPLTAGARVIILNNFDARDPSAIVAKIGAGRVTCLLSLVPTMVNALLEPAGQCPGFDSLRLILVSGEALSGSSCRRAQEAFGRHVQIVNQYGPTETTMTCSYHRVVETDYERGIVPLGKPIPNVRLYILDEHLNPASIGVQGELHVGGIGVARGYLKSPDLNAEKFIADPFVEEPGARLYKTGDLARYLPDGDIEFLGRLDNQIKIRGFRVELGEIEAVLRRHPGVREAVVIDLKSDKRLIAYFVANGAQAPAAAELREFLKAKLPDYMIPSVFILLDALPLTPNGKVDRFALPAPDAGQPEHRSALAMKQDRAPDVYERSNLTKNQLLVWLGQKLQPEVPLYNVTVTFTLSGKIDRDSFQKAFQTLINASDALRTVIEETDGVPRQTVLETLPYKIEYQDFSASSEPQAAFENWLRARGAAPIDLSKRLFDSTLAKIAPDRFVWYLNHHHIITDGWSVFLLYRYMSELYGRALNGRLDEVPTIPPFRDYVRYEREDRASPRRLAAEAYWKTKLAEKREPLNLFGESQRSPTAKIETLSCELGAERTRKLKALAAREISGASEHASVFSVLATILFTYLYRVSGNRRLSIGAPFHNRGSKAFRETLGFLTETLPLQITIEPADTFLSLIRKVRDEMSAIRPFRGVALGNPPRNKLYNVLLNYYTVTLPRFHGMPARIEMKRTGPEDEALRVRDFDGAGNFVLDFGFQSDVFNEERRRRAMRHFLRILDACVEDPAGSLNGVSLLEPEERRRMLVEWNSTKRDYPADRCIHELFEAQAARTPAAVAVVFEDRELTYGELNRRANQLAHRLRKLGIAPGAPVAICAERSLEMVVGLLGILKAGGAYVPLDPTYPRERLDFMLADARPEVILTQQQWMESLPRHGTKILSLDTGWDAMAGESGENPFNRAAPDGLAYIIYTSGSTGRPKGVEVRHRGVLRLLFRTDYVELNAEHSILQMAPISFDASTFELWGALLHGARCVLYPERIPTLETLNGILRKHRIDTLWLTASLYNLVIDRAPEILSGVRQLLIGGEALSVDHVRRGLELLPLTQIVNGYGPTESTTFACCYRIPRPLAPSLASIPIGRPIGNTEVYLLDCNLQPVPIGVPGELHIGGAGLARGYLNAPEITAEKFISHPFSDEPQARLYKTGDLARYLPDGNIEFLGRLDNQIKIRGFRVEPEEIEAVLRQHPGVREAVVAAREDVGNPKSDKRLAAYVVSNPAQAPAVSELREFLKAKLPDYMVPSAFVMIDVLPLTPNGKIDRQALPAPDPGRPELESAFVAPRSSIEETLANICARVLGLNQVGVDDNFFDLGGHSLLATQVVSRVREAYGVELSLRTFFESPTVAGIAAVIVRAKDSNAESSMPKISRVSRQSQP